MLGDKLRFRFAKTGTLRLLSHHDLMRSLERMLRRADIPFKSTAGFHPGPRVVFALSLPLGVAGLDEVVEIELTRPCESEDVLKQLQAQAPDGLTFTRCTVVPMKVTAIPRRIVYALDLPPERVAAITASAAELLAQPTVWVDRIKPSPKRLNIRPYFRGLQVANDRLTLDLWVTQTGTARADELIKRFDLADLLDAGVVVERTTVELRDEVTGTDTNDQPPDGPADTLPLDPAIIESLSRRDEEQPATAAWGASPAGPVVE